MTATEGVGTTRSGALKRLLLLAGGALGAGVASKGLLGRAEPAAVPAAANTRPTKAVTLYGRDWRLAAHSAEPGKRADPKEPRTPAGRLVDARGRELGSFRAANLLGTGGVLQLQTFDLTDGTILGIGSGGMHENPFAIVGGTGLYVGASGTYVAKQSPRETGGDGTAVFTLTLTA